MKSKKDSTGWVLRVYWETSGGEKVSLGVAKLEDGICSLVPSDRRNLLMLSDDDTVMLRLEADDEI